MSRHILLEICCGSADDVIEAERGGADRVELNSNLFQGGLTPTLGALRTVKRRTRVPVMCMVRPRAGGFCYTDTEYEVAREDARLLLENGADGLVFGFLHSDGTVDEGRTRALVDLCKGRPCVFHRALDVVPDWKRALDQLISLGVLGQYIGKTYLETKRRPRYIISARTWEPETRHWIEENDTGNESTEKEQIGNI